MKIAIPQQILRHWRIAAAIAGGVVLASVVTWGVYRLVLFNQKFTRTATENRQLSEKVASLSAELAILKNQDQYKRNQELQGTIRQIEITYTNAVSAYEDLLRLKDNEKDTSKFDDAFANILTLLSQRNYATAAGELVKFRTDIKTEQAKIAAAFVIPQTVPASNAPPGGGYSRQSVTSDAGNFLVDIIAADLGSTRVIVDTASDATCAKDCPVLSLGDYVSRSGAYAGVNGSYFCPADYPSCADKKNSFDTLLMNKNKVYFNSDNNKYSTVPAVIFGSGFIRFVGQSLDWGRDTGIDSMIAMQPLLVSGGTVVFGGNSDPKEGAKGTRAFVANRGKTVFIGVVHNATVAESARVMKAMGMDNALNLDDGGSAALWSGGYKVGPGRALPNVVLFVKK